MTDDIWASIPGFEGLYEVSFLGQIRSLARPRQTGGWSRTKILKACERHRGYLAVGLQKGKSVFRYDVHRLVLLAFIGPCPFIGGEARHLNGHKQDNRLSNLKWGTARENAADRETHGHIVRGSNHAHARLDEQSAKDILRRWVNRHESQYDLARAFGVSRSTIQSCLERKTWRHVL